MKSVKLSNQMREKIITAMCTKTDLWPESFDFIPQYLRDPSEIKLPAIRLEDINKELQ